MMFTPRVQNAFRLAAAEARALAQPFISTHHLLLGLLLLGSGVHFSILQQMGLTAETLRKSIAAMALMEEAAQNFEGFVFGVSSIDALERAAKEAAAMSHTYIGTEHVLLGLLSEQRGNTASLFRIHEIDTVHVRKMILAECGHA